MITVYEKNVAQDLGLTFERCKIHSLTPVKINFRCPLCGDSMKSKYLARAWFYEYEGKLRYGCFNCNENMLIGEFLKRYHPERYREWLRDKRGATEEVDRREKDLFSIKTPVVDELPFCERLDKLSDEHPAKRYMINRKIPSDKMYLFYFTMDWKKVANHVCPDTYKDDEREPRIIIPIYNKDGKIESIQGRALRECDGIRYLTVKTHEHANKVYGIERVEDDKKPVFYFEGPIDSVFIHNGCAIAGGQMDVNLAPFKERRVWVLDNENRQPDTMARYQRLIDAGEDVVLWDKAPWMSKDINDMVQKENANPVDIYNYLCDNIVSGLRAENRFSRWKKNDRKNQTDRKSKSIELNPANLRDRLERRNRSTSLHR